MGSFSPVVTVSIKSIRRIRGIAGIISRKHMRMPSDELVHQPIGDNSAEREKADAYADEILAVVRKARVDGIDIESALRNRLRDVEEKVALIESEINND